MAVIARNRRDRSNNTAEGGGAARWLKGYDDSLVHRQELLSHDFPDSCFCGRCGYRFFFLVRYETSPRAIAQARAPDFRRQAGEDACGEAGTAAFDRQAGGGKAWGTAACLIGCPDRRKALQR